jgi:hypothetical protein
MELNLSPRAATDRMELARDLATRLPATFTGLRDGTVSEHKAGIIYRRTSHLSAQHAAAADAILAEAAPGVRPESLDRKAYRLARRLDPGYAKRVKDDAARRRRVEARQEGSGNASLAGRELDPAEVLALMSDIKAEAIRLREAGMTGTLDEIMTAIYLDRLARRPTTAPGADDGDGSPGGDDGGGSPGGGPSGPRPGPPAGGRGRTPVPAVVNVLVSAGTLLGFCEEMSEAKAGCWTPTTAAPSPRPPPCTRGRGGASRSSTTRARRSRTAAPPDSTGGPPRSPAATRTRRPPPCCATSRSHSSPSPKAPALTATARTSTNRPACCVT